MYFKEEKPFERSKMMYSLIPEIIQTVFESSKTFYVRVTMSAGKYKS